MTRPIPTTIGVVALVGIALAGCSTSSDMLLDGGHDSHGVTTVCVSTPVANGPTIFGVGLENSSDRAVTITAVSTLESHKVDLTSIALAPAGRNGMGWGTTDLDDIDDNPDLAEAWAARREPVGASIGPGEREWLLLVADTVGEPDERAWIRGISVEFDGMPWPQSTENHNVYGFGPASGCAPGAEDEW